MSVSSSDSEVSEVREDYEYDDQRPDMLESFKLWYAKEHVVPEDWDECVLEDIIVNCDNYIKCNCKSVKNDIDTFSYRFFNYSRYIEWLMDDMDFKVFKMCRYKINGIVEFEEMSSHDDELLEDVYSTEGKDGEYFTTSGDYDYVVFNY